jgi:hypothetical protein
MKLSRRRLALLVAVALSVPAGAFGVATAHAAAAPTCRAGYTITSQWSTGFGAEVTVTNLGDAVSGWTLGWTLGAGQGITQAWNATVTVAGSAVSTMMNAGTCPIGLSPVAAITCSGSTAVGNRGFLAETRNAAATNGVPVIDLHQRSVALYNSLKGARQIAGLIATALREQGIPLASSLL